MGVTKVDSISACPHPRPILFIPLPCSCLPCPATGPSTHAQWLAKEFSKERTWKLKSAKRWVGRGDAVAAALRRRRAVPGGWVGRLAGRTRRHAGAGRLLARRSARASLSTKHVVTHKPASLCFPCLARPTPVPAPACLQLRPRRPALQPGPRVPGGGAGTGGGAGGTQARRLDRQGGGAGCGGVACLRLCLCGGLGLCECVWLPPPGRLSFGFFVVCVCVCVEEGGSWCWRLATEAAPAGMGRARSVVLSPAPSASGKGKHP